jgi:DNA-binding response OmpR family regulator
VHFALGVVVSSGLAGIEDKIKGLGFGADDYMTKPFHKDELVARINAIVRAGLSLDGADQYRRQSCSPATMRGGFR